jgi:hypothetical protein
MTEGVMIDQAVGSLEPLLSGSDEGEARWWGDSLSIIKASAAQTGGRIGSAAYAEVLATEAAQGGRLLVAAVSDNSTAMIGNVHSMPALIPSALQHGFQRRWSRRSAAWRSPSLSPSLEWPFHTETATWRQLSAAPRAVGVRDHARLRSALTAPA